jgi:hypothetical protein
MEIIDEDNLPGLYCVVLCCVVLCCVVLCCVVCERRCDVMWCDVCALPLDFLTFYFLTIYDTIHPWLYHHRLSLVNFGGKAEFIYAWDGAWTGLPEDKPGLCHKWTKTYQAIWKYVRWYSPNQISSHCLNGRRIHHVSVQGLMGVCTLRSVCEDARCFTSRPISYSSTCQGDTSCLKQLSVARCISFLLGSFAGAHTHSYANGRALLSTDTS